MGVFVRQNLKSLQSFYLLNPLIALSLNPLIALSLNPLIPTTYDLSIIL